MNCSIYRNYYISFAVHVYYLDFLFLAKATYSALSKLYGFFTPDLWEDTVFMKAPFQEFTDYLAKNHVRAKVMVGDNRV